MSKDCIQLIVPAKPEYILITRLTASAVATRVGFDVDTIEDIKIAVAEAAILIMNQEKNVKEIILYFELEENGLTIELQAGEVIDCNDSNTIPDFENREMSMFILDSMMDNVNLHTEDKVLSKIVMQKRFGSR